MVPSGGSSQVPPEYNVEFLTSFDKDAYSMNSFVHASIHPSINSVVSYMPVTRCVCAADGTYALVAEKLKINAK